MSISANAPVHIFLIQPLTKNKYKEILVYADTEQQARRAAGMFAKEEEKKSPCVHEFSAATVYCNAGMSICIEVEPDHITQLDHLSELQVTYKGVLYDIHKDEAKAVIAETLI